MKYAILSAPLPPTISGLGDHSLKLSSELSLNRHQVAIWTAEPNPVPIQGVEIFPVEQPWNYKALSTLGGQIGRWGPDCLVVQYTPQSIAPERYGINPYFVFWIYTLKRKLRCPIYIIFHELNYPLEWSVKGVTVGLPHVVQLFFLVLIANRIFCTTEYFVNKVNHMIGFLGQPLFRRKGRRRVGWLPVGANIEPSSIESPKAQAIAQRAKLGIPASQKILFHFGGLHPTHLYDYMFQALEHINTVNGKDYACLVCAGATYDDLKNSGLYPEIVSTSLSKVHWLGTIPAAEVSAWLFASDLILAPFLDGVSTRRGSVMAAFCHGKPVLTTRAWSSEGQLPWEEFCAIVPSAKKDAYAESAEGLIANPLELDRLGSCALKIYQKWFSWPVVMKRLLLPNQDKT